MNSCPKGAINRAITQTLSPTGRVVSDLSDLLSIQHYGQFFVSTEETQTNQNRGQEFPFAAETQLTEVKGALLC